VSTPLAGLHSDQKVGVIRHSADLEKLMTLFGDDPGDLLLQLLPEGRQYEGLTPQDSKYQMNVNTSISV
jgi:hypothetical protein